MANNPNTWLEKIIREFKNHTTSLNDGAIDATKNLVTNSDMQGKEVGVSELTRHAKLLLEQALRTKEKEEGTQDEN